MKKKTKKHKVAPLAGIKRRLGDILLRHYKMFQIILVVAGAIISGVVASWTLFSDVTSTATVELETQISLKTDTIDALEVVIEDRQTTYENPPLVPPSSFGL